ncbi:hypothetical protein HYDPIDRAFT_35386 [Hydnomerulius pinastri MD-312]|nr:hypothetical protein HYDPIDRAFT_35386 [Hydnomerulius pinastri MD-312]
MDRVRSAKGKKRARVEDVVPERPLHPRASSSSLSPVPDDESIPLPAAPVKKPKRAETRPCPACSELIPVRLLAAHAKLELQRVEEIIRHVGDAEVLAEVDDLEEGSSSKTRRSALKARQSLSALQPTPRIRLSSIPTLTSNPTTSPTTIAHTITHITRRRKARHARLKELAKEEASWLASLNGGTDGGEGESGGMTCPVCSQPVRGDRDVIEAHVDACLAYESRRAQVERAERERTVGLQRGSEDADIDAIDIDIDSSMCIGGGEGEGSVRTRVITSTSLRGTGIHVRQPNTLDTEDDIDIDGMDDEVFGDAQFGEADVVEVGLGEPMGELPEPGLAIDGGEGDQDVIVDGDARAHRRLGERSNHDREPIPEVPSDLDTDQLDLAILAARSRGDTHALITALEAKLNSIPAPSTCRICLSPYVDPTASTGCWHTCCKTCWLRCLGATKLCPMCQRITGAGELRRVYL